MINSQSAQISSQNAQINSLEKQAEERIRATMRALTQSLSSSPIKKTESYATGASKDPTINHSPEEFAEQRLKIDSLKAKLSSVEAELEAHKQKNSLIIKNLMAAQEFEPPTPAKPNTAATSGEIEEAATAGAEAEAPFTPIRQIKRDQKAAAPAVSSDAQESAKAAVLSTIPEAPALPAEITANEPVDVFSSKSGAGPERGVS
jgi:hypothetical protein